MTQTMTQSARILAQIQKAETAQRNAKVNEVNALKKTVLKKAGKVKKLYNKSVELVNMYNGLSCKHYDGNAFYTRGHGYQGDNLFFMSVGSSKVGLFCSDHNLRHYATALAGFLPVNGCILYVGRYGYDYDTTSSLYAVEEVLNDMGKVANELDYRLAWLKSLSNTLDYFAEQFQAFYKGRMDNANKYLAKITPPSGVKKTASTPRKTAKPAKTKATPKKTATAKKATAKTATPPKPHAEIVVSGFNMRESDMGKYLPQAYFMKFQRMTTAEKKTYMIKLVASVNATFGEVMKDKFKSVVRQTLTQERHEQANAKKNAKTTKKK